MLATPSLHAIKNECLRSPVVDSRSSGRPCNIDQRKFANFSVFSLPKSVGSLLLM